VLRSAPSRTTCGGLVDQNLRSRRRSTCSNSIGWHTVRNGDQRNMQTTTSIAGPIGPIPEGLVAYISSVLPPALMASDLALDPARPEFRSTNLKTASALRLHKRATIHGSMIVRHLGTAAVSEDKCGWEVTGSAGRLVI